MSVMMNDCTIRRYARRGMITPFCERTQKDGVISYGLSSYGYDLRIADEYKIFTPVHGATSPLIDPKNFRSELVVDYKGRVCVIPANSFALGRSKEYLKIPRDVLAICLGKSTLARMGIIVNVTPLEPEWEGYVTIEVSNTAPVPAKIYSNEGICQVIFFKTDMPCGMSYADRKGKYQKQRGIVLPRVDR